MLRFPLIYEPEMLSCKEESSGRPRFGAWLTSFLLDFCLGPNFEADIILASLGLLKLLKLLILLSFFFDPALSGLTLVEATMTGTCTFLRSHPGA